MDTEALRKLIEEAWGLTEAVNAMYVQEWARDEQNIPLMQRLAGIYKRADARYWRRADALMAAS